MYLQEKMWRKRQMNGRKPFVSDQILKWKKIVYFHYMKNLLIEIWTKLCTLGHISLYVYKIWKDLKAKVLWEKIKNYWNILLYKCNTFFINVVFSQMIPNTNTNSYVLDTQRKKKKFPFYVEFFLFLKIIKC